MQTLKKEWLFVAFSLVQAGVHAQTMNSGAMSAPSATSTAGNQEFTQGITFNSNTPDETRTKIEYSGTQTVKNVPSVTGPPLTTSNDTCMGSSSGGLNGPGFGISMGSTWADTNCKLLKNSRELWNMGMKAAALALMCTDTQNREALELTGFECPQSARERKGAEKVSIAVTRPPPATEAAVVAPRPPPIPVETPMAAPRSNPVSIEIPVAIPSALPPIEPTKGASASQADDAPPAIPLTTAPSPEPVSAPPDLLVASDHIAPATHDVSASSTLTENSNVSLPGIGVLPDTARVAHK